MSSPRTRFPVAASVAVGLALAAVSWSPAGSPETLSTRAAATVAPVDRDHPAHRSTATTQAVDHEAAPATTTPATPATTTPATTTPATGEAPVTTAPPVTAPVVAPAPSPPPTTEVPSTAVSSTTVPAGHDDAVPAAAAIHVEVAPVEGAQRWVSLRSADGDTVAGPVAVDGTVIRFAGLDDGTYDVFAEQMFRGGGTFLTRTTVEVSGEDVFVRCTGDDLGCSVT